MDGLIQEAKLINNKIKPRYGGHREDTGYHIDERDNGNKLAKPRYFVLGKEKNNLLLNRNVPLNQSVTIGVGCCEGFHLGDCSVLVPGERPLSLHETKNSGSSSS